MGIIYIDAEIFPNHYIVNVGTLGDSKMRGAALHRYEVYTRYRLRFLPPFEGAVQ